MPIVDLVVGPQAYHRLPAMARAGGGVDTEFPAEDKFEHLPKPAATRRAPAAFLTVQEGCDKFCAFCVVPYTRGERGFAPRPAHSGRGARSGLARGARNHAFGPERQWLAWRGHRGRRMGPAA